MCRRLMWVGGSGGRGAGWPVWSWVGRAGEGDFEAEGFVLADVVSDLAAGGGLTFVVVRAEVVVPGAGVGQQLVVDPQLGVAEGDMGFCLAAAAGPDVAPASWYAGYRPAPRDSGRWP
jgi:hypothetical protein